MNVREMCQEVNIMLARMDEQCTRAQKLFGVKPNLVLAKEGVNVAGATVMELANLLSQMEGLGFRHPPDVIQRVRDRYQGLHKMAFEITECEMIISVRSQPGRPATALN